MRYVAKGAPQPHFHLHVLEMLLPLLSPPGHRISTKILQLSPHQLKTLFLVSDWYCNKESEQFQLVLAAWQPCCHAEEIELDIFLSDSIPEPSRGASSCGYTLNPNQPKKRNQWCFQFPLVVWTESDAFTVNLHNDVIAIMLTCQKIAVEFLKAVSVANTKMPTTSMPPTSILETCWSEAQILLMRMLSWGWWSLQLNSTWCCATEIITKLKTFCCKNSGCLVHIWEMKIAIHKPWPRTQSVSLIAPGIFSL